MTTTETLPELATDPQAFDTELAAQHRAADYARGIVRRNMDAIHAAAGDGKRSTRQGFTWKRTAADVLADPKVPSSATETLTKAQERVAEIAVAIMAMDEVYRSAPWSRFFPTETNSGGHIHATTGCSTLQLRTVITWRPDLSGKTVEQAVADLGPALCQVCFPAAKAEWKRSTLGQVAKDRSRAERDAAKAARDAKAATKRLTPEQVREIGRVDGDRIETVAACVELLRHEVEMRDYYGQGEHPNHAALVQGAEVAKRVLIAREAAHEGHGKTADEIATIVERAIRRNIKDGAREDMIRAFA
jgi:hypothetical protein